MAGLAQTLRGLGAARLAAMAIVTAAMIGVFAYLTNHVATPSLSLLYGDIELRDSGQIVQKLEAMGVPYQVRGDGGGAEDGAGGNAAEQRVNYENRLSRNVEGLLERSVGPVKARVDVHADVDFDKIATSSESYDRDGQAVRSTQSVTDSSDSNEAGVVRRLSVAAPVDGTYAPAADGTRNYQPRSGDELKQLTALVRSAIGYDEKRGDAVEVVNLRFTAPEELPAAAPTTILGLERQEVMRIGELLVVAVLGLLFLLLVARPLLLRLAETAAKAPALLPGARGRRGARRRRLGQYDRHRAGRGARGRLGHPQDRRNRGKASGPGADAATAAAAKPGLVGRTVADVERDLILETLQHCLGHRTPAATILGISIRTLRNKLQQYRGEGMAVPHPGDADQITA